MRRTTRGNRAPRPGSAPRPGTCGRTAGRRQDSAAVLSSASTSPSLSPHRRYPAGVIRWRSGEVSALGQSWPGAQELEVTVDGSTVRALAYPALTGTPQPGDRVLLNTGALDLGLGTGG